MLSVIYSQDIHQVSESKRDVAYGQDCDDTEYRNLMVHLIGKIMDNGYLNVTQFFL